VKKFKAFVFAALAYAATLLSAHAQGTVPIALSQVMNATGQPVVGAQLFIYQVGTVQQLQQVFSDPALTLPIANPMIADANGRLPMFYLAPGSVHVRLTDASGVVQFDYPSMLVIGAAGGSSSGGAVDPSSIASTGDMKFRPTSESLVGWVKLNAQTIGSPTSGATGRANNDTQNLFVYLWNNFTNAKCPVSGGRGANGLADFQANKTIGLPDWRGRGPIGLDDMQNTPLGLLQALNVTSPGDTVTTPAALGGQAVHMMTNAEVAPHTHGMTINDPGHQHGGTFISGGVTSQGGASGCCLVINGTTNLTQTAFTGLNSSNVLVNATGGAQSPAASPFNVMTPFILGSWHMKL
jgi:hypothetical protein